MRNRQTTNKQADKKTQRIHFNFSRLESSETQTRLRISGVN